MKKAWKLLIPTLLLGLAPAVKADPPICQVTCAIATCSQNSDCAAFPGTRCKLACPGVGCCV
jgi:hypothetical protein